MLYRVRHDDPWLVNARELGTDWEITNGGTAASD